jgi:ATP-dependent Lon protease
MADFLLPDYNTKGKDDVGEMGNGSQKMYKQAEKVLVLTRMVEDPNKVYLLEITPVRDYITKSVKDYLSEFVEFERSIREKIWSISHGQLGVKKLIWQYIVNYVTSCSLTSVKRPILLIGPPGVGKTFISMCLARILCFEPDEKPTDEEVQKCVVIISTPSISSESALFGTSFVYVGAVPGQITSALLFRAQLGRIVLVIDEIDKTCKYV